ncbi:GNAT family N-acetyltransferase [Embleya sp. NPDC020886]|uniref:GNAT family N-acetyltransferase n=1 Tax=Embleya sp. NPDC020886 TaxID=3363980 RepID=UPI003795434F
MTPSQPAARLRPARPDDLDAIVDLHTRARAAYYRTGGAAEHEIEDPTHPDPLASRRDAWRRAVDTDARTVVCAIAGDRVVGVAAMGRVTGPAGELYQIHVSPKCWGQGIGTALHAEFVRFLDRERLSEGRVEAWRRNERAMAFYARHGWSPSGEHRPGPAGGDYVRMRLTATG